MWRTEFQGSNTNQRDQIILSGLMIIFFKVYEWELQNIWAIIKKQNLCIIIIKRDEIHAKRNFLDKNHRRKFLKSRRCPSRDKRLTECRIDRIRKRNSPCHTILTLQIKYVLKAEKKKYQVTWKGRPIWITVSHSLEALAVRMGWKMYFKLWKFTAVNLT